MMAVPSVPCKKIVKALEAHGFVVARIAGILRHEQGAAS